MLEIINNLRSFIEDCYREIGVREYARENNISPPTASNILKNFENEGLLKVRKDRRYLLFRTNRESQILKDLSKIYWKWKLNDFVEYLNSILHEPTIVLFGSLSKLETKKESDIDISIFARFNKDLELKRFENKYRRKIQVFIYESLDKVNKELKTNILNGYVIKGELK